jgi:small conductance mechanosensitive channel
VVAAGMASSSNVKLPSTAPDISTLRGFWHEHASLLITKPLQILAIIVVSVIIRWLLHRSIGKLTSSNGESRVPRILSPLAERAANLSFWESSGLASERRSQRAETIGSVLKSTTSFIVFTFAFLVILQEIGLNLAPFIAGTSLIGVAVGFGAQNLVKDFLAGIFMIMEDQYGVGDVIDLKEATGTVEAVGLRTTRIRDSQGTVWYVRNGEIVRVGNKTQGFAQVVLDIPIAADVDLRAATGAMESAAAATYADPDWRESFLSAPEVLGVESIGLEETVIRLVARVRPLEQWRTGRELRGRIRVQFDREQITHRVAGPDSDAAANNLH